MNLLRMVTGLIARLLPADIEDAVLGDLYELEISPRETFLAMCGVLFHREIARWRHWQPWAAAAIVLPATLLLLDASFTLAMDSRTVFSGRAAGAPLGLLCEALLLVAWAGTTGFAVGSLARRSTWVCAMMCIIPCAACVVRFHVPSLSRYHVLLFLLPAIPAAIAGTRRGRLRFATAMSIAFSATALMIAWSNMWSGFWILAVPSWFLVLTAFDPTSRWTGSGSAMRRRVTLNLLMLLLLAVPAFAATNSSSRLVADQIHSKSFAAAKIPIDPSRKIVVYLPPGYDSSPQMRYPVIYYIPSSFDSSIREIFDKRDAEAVMDRAIAHGTIRPFLFVTVDMTTPIGSSWSVNSSATGNWEDFVITELVPYIDSHFRTLTVRDSRGIAGHFMGGYGALRLAMEHPDVFGSVYALHPVGTGNGVKILAGLPNWELMQNAKSLDDVKKDGYSTIFTSIFEAHTPNPSNPPLYIDFPAHSANSKLVIDDAVMDRLRNNFFLESLVGRYAANLKSLRGVKFDWSRTDQNFDHVYSNQAFTHKLNEYGIPHEAEEYNAPLEGDPNWGTEGRITTDLLPFFDRHLAF